METYRYSTQLIRLTASLIAALYITLHGRWHLIGKALVTPAFYLALMISFCIAYLLMYFVHIANSKLDQKYPLQKNILTRIIWQFLLCVVVPAFIDLALFYFYFEVRDKDFMLGSFFIHDFPIAILFLLILNIYYLYLSSVLSHRKPNSLPVEELLTIDYSGSHVRLNPSTEILFFYRDGKVVKLLTIIGKEYAIKDSITHLNDQFKGHKFCQINPSTIVNLRKVKGHTAGVKRDTRRVLFNVEYHELITKQNIDLLKITKKYLQDFKNAFEMLQH